MDFSFLGDGVSFKKHCWVEGSPIREDRVRTLEEM